MAGSLEHLVVVGKTHRKSPQIVACNGDSKLLRGHVGFGGTGAGEKRGNTTTVAPLLSRSVARPRGHRGKKAMVHTILLGKQGKRVYTIGPERRVYT